MENRENARYIVLANVNGKKTAIRLDGLYTILPPQNFPLQIPRQIQYKDERIPLYDAKELVGFFENKTHPKVSYEKMYRELLGKVKEVSDEIVRLKQDLVNSMRQDLTQFPVKGIPAPAAKLSTILAAANEGSSNTMDLLEKVKAGQEDMADKFNLIKKTLEDMRKQEGDLFNNIDELKTNSAESGVDLTKMAESLSAQDRSGQKLHQVVKLQEDVENKLISILFNFGIRLRKEENPEDENIKRGEQMLDMLQGEKKDAIQQEEVDRLLSEFLK